MTQETGIQSSLSEDDMKLYLQEVIQDACTVRYGR
jgi:hypothetical protein